jgi:hypothetical protein
MYGACERVREPKSAPTHPHSTCVQVGESIKELEESARRQVPCNEWRPTGQRYIKTRRFGATHRAQ